MSTPQSHYIHVAARWLVAWAVAVGSTITGCLHFGKSELAFIPVCVLSVAFIVGWCWRGADAAWSKIEKTQQAPDLTRFDDARAKVVREYWAAVPLNISDMVGPYVTLCRRRAVKLDD